MTLKEQLMADFKEAMKAKDEVAKNTISFARAAVKQYEVDNREELDEIYDKLVKIRTEIAHTLGFENFVEYSYVSKQRSYTAKDVANFRKQVKEVMVPKNLEYKKQQAEKIGVENFMFYDDAYAYPDGSTKINYKYMITQDIVFVKCFIYNIWIYCAI